MAAWTHSKHSAWSDSVYQGYRSAVTANAWDFRGHEGLDCADLSMKLLVDFAAKSGLCLTFKDDQGLYISKADGMLDPNYGGVGAGAGAPALEHRPGTRWKNKDHYFDVVHLKMITKTLWDFNTENVERVSPGDLLIQYKRRGWRNTIHHTALVFRVYPPGQSHPWEDRKDIPDFPGDDVAKNQVDQTLYFRGTINDDTEVTASRRPDQDTHIDYLNYRSKKKDRAEIILFGNLRQFLNDGMETRKWAKSVIDNWSDWDGSDVPPR